VLLTANEASSRDMVAQCIALQFFTMVDQMQGSAVSVKGEQRCKRSSDPAI
jgi:hypothetical protein